MSWPCKLHPERPDNPKPGDMWPVPLMVESDHAGFYERQILSCQYLTESKGKHAPLCVRLPCGFDFCLDSRYR